MSEKDILKYSSNSSQKNLQESAHPKDVTINQVTKNQGNLKVYLSEMLDSTVDKKNQSESQTD